MKIANFPAIAAPIRETISEPISPELVLVDQELRRALLAQAAREAQAALERARLQVVPDVEPPSPEPRTEPERPARPTLVRLPQPSAPASGSRSAPLPPLAPRPPAWPRRYLVPVLLPISLALNAILIAFAVSDATTSSEPTPPPPALNVTPPGNAAGQHAKGDTKPPAAKGTKQKPRNPALERKLLNLIVQAPAGKLPRALIDSKTGLAKNGLQAVCRRESARSSLCLIQPAKHKPGEGLYARYRVNRNGNGGTFTWYPYRKG